MLLQKAAMLRMPNADNKAQYSVTR